MRMRVVSSKSAQFGNCIRIVDFKNGTARACVGHAQFLVFGLADVLVAAYTNFVYKNNHMKVFESFLIAWLQNKVIKTHANNFQSRLHRFCRLFAKRYNICSPSIYVPQPTGGRHIHIGAVPVGFSVGLAFSCLHSILLTSGWILTIFLWYNLDITKNWLHFGDLDIIFKVTAVKKKKENSRMGNICFLWKHHC